MTLYTYLLFLIAGLWLCFVLSLSGCNHAKEKGDVGDSGAPGTPGAAGESCTTSTGADGCTILQCGVSTSSICNGTDGSAGERGDPGRDGVDGSAGVDGRDGVDATPATLVTPCPETAGSVPYPERFIRLAAGSIVAFYSDPDYMRQRLVTLVVGTTYITTDGRNCTYIAE